MAEPNSWHPGGFDACHIPAGTFDAQDLGLYAEQVLLPRLDRSVAAAMQNEFRLPAEEPRRINTPREVCTHAGLCPIIKSRLGVAIDPGRSHRALALVAQQTLAPPATLGRRRLPGVCTRNHGGRRRRGGRGYRWSFA